MPSFESVDVVVIGAGTAGMHAFNTLARAGRSVLLVDQGPLGTTCARVGCMPSKAALHAGRQWASLRSLLGDTAVPAGAASPLELWHHALKTRDMLAAGAAQRTRTAAGDRLRVGHARFVDPATVDVDGRRIRAQVFVVATGSEPVLPSGLETIGPKILTTDTLFSLGVLPARLGVLGLGAIGLEMGLALARLGVEVVGADLREWPAGINDPVVGAAAVAQFGSEMALWLGSRAEVLSDGDTLRLRSDGREQTVDQVLVALGRRPRLAGLDLERAGVALDTQGLPAIDGDTLRAAESPIFIAGDANPERPLMHEAADEGAAAARAALDVLAGRPATPLRRRTALAVVFSDPDVVTVGARLDELGEADRVVGSASGLANGRSRILGAESNLVRVYAHRSTGQLMGASLMASRGEHLAHLLAWAIQRGESVQSLLSMPYYHPSIEELVQGALTDAARQLQQ
ncbi:MAG: dihydrolipoyl dehydrogenase [Proteobacteria bacterium]|nr:dihydrolipoyl dehydrogenase [Pseudomonadota bacterium]